MAPEVEALAGFLNAIDFTHFCTFTTRKPSSVASMRRIAESIARFVDAGNTSTMFWAAEKFDSTDGMLSTANLRYPGDSHRADYTTTRYHFHALLRTHMPSIEIWNHCHTRYGRCDIINNTDQDKRHSASWYCSKYVVKRPTDYDIYFGKEIQQRGQTKLYRMMDGYDRFLAE